MNGERESIAYLWWHTLNNLKSGSFTQKKHDKKLRSISHHPTQAFTFFLNSSAIYLKLHSYPI